MNRNVMGAAPGGCSDPCADTTGGRVMSRPAKDRPAWGEPDDSDPAPYFTYRQFMQERYGEPLYRVPVDPGFGCPNRRADGSGGCAFCGAAGARSMQTRSVQTIEEQVEKAMAFARERYGARRFMAYIQAFTGTFAPHSEQRRLYLALLERHSFDALAVGTRPDCLPAETIELLRTLRRRTDVWVELGVQTVHDATLARLHRGHDWAASRTAIGVLKAAGLQVAVHVILGLPGETVRHFRETALALAALPLDGIKIHNLHVVRGSALADEFARQPFPVYDEEAYAAIVIDFLRHLPPRLPIFRLCTDTPEDELIAPRWRMTKSQFIPWVRDRMRAAGIRQGDRLPPVKTA